MQRKSFKIIGTVIFAAFIVAIVMSVVYNQSLTDIDKKESLLSLISTVENENENNVVKVDYMALNDEAIDELEVNVVENKNFAAVFYKSNNRNNIIVLKKSKLFSNKYKYFGNSSSTNSYSVFNYQQSEHSKLKYVVAVSSENNEAKGVSLFKDNSKANDEETEAETEKRTKDSIIKIDFDEIPYYNLFVDEFDCDDGDYIETEFY